MQAISRKSEERINPTADDEINLKILNFTAEREQNNG